MFAGPTLARARRIDPALSLHGFEIRSPAKRGDVATLVAHVPAGTIVLVDGLFHQNLAVGHVEIRDALAAGWRVWGLASMGAIRAREMSHLGMHGFGRVFEMFCSPDKDFRDDEVVLLHAPGPGYAELSEPLVHLRIALADFATRALLSDAVAGAITDQLAGMYFGDRTLRRFGELVAQAAGPGFDPLADFDAHRIKSHDLLAFVRDSVHLHATGQGS
jgi:hypothetical protein